MADLILKSMIKHAFSFLYRSDVTIGIMEKKRDSFFLANKKQKTGRPEKKPENKRQEEFDKKRDVKQNKTEKENDKKPFDKKSYRLKKYSKKYKLEQWEEQRKKKLIREYQKDVKTDPTVGSYKPKSFDEDTTDSQDVGKYVRHPDIIEKENIAVKPKRDPFKKAKDHFNKIKDDKIKKREELEKVIAERNKKLQEYKKNKHERFKKLSKKNKKGQPMMTGRMELLLEKIQKG